MRNALRRCNVSNESPRSRQDDFALQLREHLLQMLLKLRGYKLGGPQPFGTVVQRKREKNLS